MNGDRQRKGGIEQIAGGGAGTAIAVEGGMPKLSWCAPAEGTFHRAPNPLFGAMRQAVCGETIRVYETRVVCVELDGTPGIGRVCQRCKVTP